jgi:hypothetical protein
MVLAFCSDPSRNCAERAFLVAFCWGRLNPVSTENSDLGKTADFTGAYSDVPEGRQATLKMVSSEISTQIQLLTDVV